MVLEQVKARAIRWLEDNRGLVIVAFCLPASFLFDLFIQLRIWLDRAFSVETDHEQRVQKIQDRVATWSKLPKAEKKLLCTARPNWLSLSTTFFDKKKCHQVPIDLHNVLSLDEENLTVTVEPNVTVREICKYLISKGYTLAVTLEIGDATLGGLAFGVGMTTYSHKVGLYQEAILEYEVVTADGKRIKVTDSNEHSDLFYCLPWSHGTLGFLVGLTLKIVKVKPYVHIQYIPCHSQEEYCAKIMELSGAKNKDAKVADYLEVTIYDKEKAVIMVGNFADLDESTNAKVNDVCWFYKPWFYKHVETFLENGGEEYIPLESYLLRHNRAIFWVLESMIPFGNHPVFRALLGWLCPPKPAFLKFTTTQAVREMTFAKQVFQDIVMPLDTLKDQVNTAIKLFDTFPLLVYPCRIYDHKGGAPQGQLRAPPSERLVPGTNYSMFNDLGVYGTPGPVERREEYNPTYAMRAMEKFTRDVGGYSFLYADIFMTEEEFNEMFDMTLYNQVRTKYHCDGAFPRLYDKVKPEIDVIAIGESYAVKKSE